MQSVNAIEALAIIKKDEHYCHWRHLSFWVGEINNPDALSVENTIFASCGELDCCSLDYTEEEFLKEYKDAEFVIYD